MREEEQCAAEEKGEHRRNGKDLWWKTAERGNGPQQPGRSPKQMQSGDQRADDPRSRTLFSLLAAPP